MKLTITLVFCALLMQGFTQDVINKTGSFCEESITLSVALAPGAEIVAWQKNGVILEGEVSAALKCATYGAGKYTVILLKTGETNSFSIDLETTEEIIPDFKGTNYLAAAVTFFADESVATKDIIAWHWDFGNGETSSLQHPRVMFTEQKEYTIILTITTSTGCKQSITKIHNWSYN